MTCTAHHHACACREAAQRDTIAGLEAGLATARADPEDVAGLLARIERLKAVVLEVDDELRRNRVARGPGMRVGNTTLSPSVCIRWGRELARLEPGDLDA